MIALICDEQAMTRLGNGLDDVMAHVEHRYSVPRNTELHGHEIVNGARHWSALNGKHREAKLIYEAALRVVEQNAVKIVIRGVDVERLNKRYKRPFEKHELTLAHTLDRVNKFVRDANTWTLLIADELGGKQEQYRSFFESIRRSPRKGMTDTPLDCFVDTMHFGPSDASRFIQAADLTLYLYRRVCTAEQENRHPKARLRDEQLLRIVSDKLSDDSGLWEP